MLQFLLNLFLLRQTERAGSPLKRELKGGLLHPLVVDWVILSVCRGWAFLFLANCVDLLTYGQRWRGSSLAYFGKILSLNRSLFTLQQNARRTFLGRVAIGTCFKSLLNALDVLDDAVTSHFLSKLTVRVLLAARQLRQVQLDPW